MSVYLYLSGLKALIGVCIAMARYLEMLHWYWLLLSYPYFGLRFCYKTDDHTLQFATRDCCQMRKSLLFLLLLLLLESSCNEFVGEVHDGFLSVSLPNQDSITLYKYNESIQINLPHIEESSEVMIIRSYESILHQAITKGDWKIDVIAVESDSALNPTFVFKVDSVSRVVLNHRYMKLEAVGSTLYFLCDGTAK